MQELEKIIADVEPLLQAAGLSLVEFTLSRGKASVKTRVVVYSPGGTGTAECSKAHRLVYPRLQEFLGVEDPYLEVASPGIDRPIKSLREYRVFTGKRIKLLLVNENEWLTGKISRVEDSGFDLEMDKETLTIDFAAVTKARLDSTQEGD